MSLHIVAGLIVTVSGVSFMSGVLIIAVCAVVAVDIHVVRTTVGFAGVDFIVAIPVVCNIVGFAACHIITVHVACVVAGLSDVDFIVVVCVIFGSTIAYLAAFIFVLTRFASVRYIAVQHIGGVRQVGFAGDFRFNQSCLVQ